MAETLCLQVLKGKKDLDVAKVVRFQGSKGEKKPRGKGNTKTVGG